MVVTMLTAASAAPTYISLTALIMDCGGISLCAGATTSVGAGAVGCGPAAILQAGAGG